MGILKKLYNNTVKDLVFTIAYRLADDEDKLFNDYKGGARFKHIPINNKFWYADPMLFNYDNEIYLFYEIYDRKKCKGCIGVSVYNNDKMEFSEPRIIIEEEYHLSYPCVFESNGEIYMIPETEENNCIQIYKATSFPYNWEYVKPVIKGINCVDTTFLKSSGDILYFMTHQLDQKDLNVTKKIIFQLENRKMEFMGGSFCTNNTGSEYTRSAGNIVLKNGTILRPAQDCSGHEYGKALIFYELDSMDFLKELYVKRIDVKDIKVGIKQQVFGMHSYAVYNNLEVVDVKFRVRTVNLKHNLIKLFKNLSKVISAKYKSF